MDKRPLHKKALAVFLVTILASLIGFGTAYAATGYGNWVGMSGNGEYGRARTSCVTDGNSGGTGYCQAHGQATSNCSSGVIGISSSLLMANGAVVTVTGIMYNSGTLYAGTGFTNSGYASGYRGYYLHTVGYARFWNGNSYDKYNLPATPHQLVP